ncbi:MAG: hypothetical protein ACTSV7_12245, partial [Candidatus Baldrarchaeia archaeon]
VYMKLTPVESLATIEKLVKTVKELRGVLVVLWHNTSLALYSRDQRKLYDKMITMLKAENALITTSREIIRHWENMICKEEVE